MIFRRILMRILVWRLKHIGDNSFILIVAGIIGLISGLAAVTLKTTVHWIQLAVTSNRLYENLNYVHLIYPMLGILLTVLLTHFIFKEKLGHGITHILYSISKRSSIIRKTHMYSRMITSAITVGLGGSVGLEAPIVVTGSAIGSNLARLAHLDYKKRTLLIGCGAAGAISGIFNSPIAGVIFAIEVILTEVTINKFIPILIASVCGQLVAIVLLGEDILFSFRVVDGFQASETPYYLLLGFFCGGVSIYFTRLIYKSERLIGSIKNQYLRAASGGLGLALIIFIFPPIYGEGYDTIKQLLTGNQIPVLSNSLFDYISQYKAAHIIFFLLIILIKPIATALTIGSGGSGGIFAPSLFIGGITGYLVGMVFNMILPGEVVNPSHFALVGMGGMLSGVLQAPLTGIFLIAEVTGGYMLFVPLMLVSAISFSTMNYFEKYSLYTKHLIESGDLITHDKDLQVLTQINLKKLVEKDLLKIHPDRTVEDLVHLVKKSKRNIFPVINDQNELVGIITLDRIREIMFDQEARKEVVVKTLMQQVPNTVSPNESMRSVMSKFETTQAWNLPVIEDGQYLGFVSKSRIFNAYRTKLIRQSKE
ncbi:MAG: chloride channel protein [Cyclobacteriaceae bacterium]